MSDLYCLTDEQMERLRPFFPKSHGKPRVDNRRVLSGIIFVNRNGMRWRDAPREYGPHKTLYNRRSDMGIFMRMDSLSAAKAEPQTIMFDATYLKARRTASTPGQKKGSRPPDRSHQRWYEHEAACDHRSEWTTALSFFMTAGQISDYTGAAALLDSLPATQWMLGDRGYDADWFRDALEEKGIKPCIPGRRSRGKPVKYDRQNYKRRNRIEIMFGRLKDWRRVATRYDRCPTVFFSAISLAATVIFWLCVLSSGHFMLRLKTDYEVFNAEIDHNTAPDDNFQCCAYDLHIRYS